MTGHLLALRRSLRTLPPGTARAVRRAGPAALAVLARCYERWRQRQILAALSDHQLRDVGLTRADVRRETRRPFWR